uniref:AAA ATPase AAA+ lid domain-containing protein n=1 Tax=Saimiri boliviensis boliviensis TaxID=39432 RepID=A0A2K6TBE0_SAIBB
SMIHAEAFSCPLTHNEVVGLIFHLTIFGAVMYFTIKWMVDAIDPTRKQKVEAQEKSRKTNEEMSIPAHLIDHLNMHVTWHDITDLKNTVIFPVKKKHLFENSRLLQLPKVVLLYWPLDCGKTLIAKTTAKEADCRFINLQESQKLAAAVFSLAINSDHEATAMVKAHCQVIVMRATHRPWNLDWAIMRRMPTRFYINQPALKQREAILKLILKNENVDRHVEKLLEVAQETDGFSGSDLKGMCQDAALLCVGEYVNSTSEESHDEDEIWPVQQEYLYQAIEKMMKSKDAAFQNVLIHLFRLRVKIICTVQ